MRRLAFIVLGLFSLVAGTGILGTWLRKNPSRSNAEKSSRILHFLFFAGVVAPNFVVWLPPGPGQLDKQVGMKPLPGKPLFFALGIILALPGLYLLAASNKMLQKLGDGANAFRLTKRVVLEDVYRYTRNPMSLGSYLLWLSEGFISGSSFVTLTALFGLIPAHLFFLKYFEETELELRLGDDYLEYKRKVPFLIPTIAIDVD